jgi:hypothetical protein
MACCVSRICWTYAIQNKHWSTLSVGSAENQLDSMNGVVID